MTQLTNIEFKAQTTSLFPTNGIGAISALDLRAQMDNVADSLTFQTTGKTVGPTANDDGVNTGSNGIFLPGHLWLDETANEAYVCLDNTSAAAIWITITTAYANIEQDDILKVASATTINFQGNYVIVTDQVGVANVEVISPYDIRTGFTTTPTTDQILDTILITRTLTFAADFAGSLGQVGTNPTASFDILVKDDGTPIGTINVTTGGAVSFTTVGNTAKVVAVGSVLTLVAPTVVDATVTDGILTLNGTI